MKEGIVLKNQALQFKRYKRKLKRKRKRLGLLRLKALYPSTYFDTLAIPNNPKPNAPIWNSKIKVRKSIPVNINQMWYTSDKKLVTLISPDILCLKTNPDGVIDFTNRIVSCFNPWVKIFVDFSEVKLMEPSAVFIICSTLQTYSLKHSVLVKYEHPKDRRAFQVYVNSGILDQLVDANGKRKRERNFAKGKMGTCNAKIKSDVIKNLCQNARDIFPKLGELGHSNLFEVLTESMANAAEHAHEEGVYGNWWVQLYYDNENEKIKICLFDHGRGILKTLRLSKFHQVRYNILGLGNKTILQQAFSGLYRIRNKNQRENRGRGLGDIYKFSTIEPFSSFIAITNNVHYSHWDNGYRFLTCEFNGTIYYWEFGNGTS